MYKLVGRWLTVGWFTDIYSGINLLSFLMAFLLKTKSLQELNTICITMVLKKEKKIIAPPLVQLKACSCYCVGGVVDVLVTDCFCQNLQIKSLMATSIWVFFGTLLSTAGWRQILFYKCNIEAKKKKQAAPSHQSTSAEWNINNFWQLTSTSKQCGWAATSITGSHAGWQPPRRSW